MSRAAAAAAHGIEPGSLLLCAEVFGNVPAAAEAASATVTLMMPPPAASALRTYVPVQPVGNVTVVAALPVESVTVEAGLKLAMQLACSTAPWTCAASTKPS